MLIDFVVMERKRERETRGISETREKVREFLVFRVLFSLEGGKVA
jgi:hypothetical protein